MNKYRFGLQVITLGVALMPPSVPSQAFELSGAWATDKSACDKVFTKKGNTISFKETSDIVGSGFIVDGKQLRGKESVARLNQRRWRVMSHTSSPHVPAISCSQVFNIHTRRLQNRIAGVPGYGRPGDLV